MIGLDKTKGLTKKQGVQTQGRYQTNSHCHFISIAN